ncbi:MAG: glycosyltransferase [Candidatus Marinimicrobia bacterium]|nr:glycosyltransferase [Candidatus Neomarinimicrobiota bacterium]MCF7851425.1 glycosyltransferase [Candidatus Neomarinimicrobiota bacterium]MCF7904960.1 glycosyltransferase [Candidatus Neomarinimicrobiota bacterium]
MKLSVIIVNYNVKAFLQQALDSIQKSTKDLETEIFVVDNHSVDGSVDLIRSDFPDVKLIANSENLGFAKANNQALEQASGDFVWLLNPDTLVQEDTAEKLIHTMEADESIGMLGCKILNDDGSLQLACRRSFPTPWVAFTKLLGLSRFFPKSKLFGKYNLTHLDENDSYEVEAISGSCMFIRRGALDTVGFLDDTFFMYGEDLDWCFRFRKGGWKVFYTAETSIVHYKGESSKVAAWDSLTHFYKAMDIFSKKHFSSGRRWPLHWLLRGGILIRYLVSLMSSFGRNSLRYLLDITGLLLVTLGSIYLKFDTFTVLDQYKYVLPVYLGIWVVTISSFGLYRHYKYSVSRSILAVTTGFLVNVTLTYFFKAYAFSRVVMLFSYMGALLWVPIWRVIASSRRTENFELGTQKVLIIGGLEDARDIYSRLMTNLSLGYTPAGIVTIEKLDEEDERVIGVLDDLIDLVQYHGIRDVIFTSDNFQLKQIFSYLPQLSQLGVKIKLVSGNLSFIVGKSTVENIQPVQLVTMDFKYFHLGSRIMKRSVDILLGILLLLFVRPFQGFATRKRQYRKTQIEIDNKVYTSFATDVNGGKFWNNLSLLPLVIRGKLSLVGAPVDLKETVAGVKQGLFNLESVRGGSQLSEDERYTLLNYYLHNHSVLLDFEIIIKSMLGR